MTSDEVLPIVTSKHAVTIQYKIPSDDVIVHIGNNNHLTTGNVNSKSEYLLEKPSAIEISPSASRIHQDRGWAWAVFVACFAGRIIINGTMLTFNIYFSLFLQVFQESRGVTALIGSVMWACYDSTAILSGFLVERLGPRWTIIIGGWMLMASLVISSFATDAIQLVFSFGVMVGLGCQFVSMGSVCGLRIYFNRFLYFVQGVSTAGAGTGMLILGIVIPILIDDCGWRGTMVIQGGLLFNMCIVGTMMFPEKKTIIRNGIDEDRRQKCFANSCRLWTKLEFWCLLCSYFLFGFSYVILMVLFKDYVILLDLSEYFSLALSLLAIGDIIGRVGSGVISSTRFGNPVILYSIVHYSEAALLTGFTAISSGKSLLACSMLYGLAAGFSNGLFYILPCHLFKTSVFHSAFPFLSTATGLGSFSGTPIAGYLTDQTGSYTGAFWLAGFSAFGSASFILYVFISQRQKHDITTKENNYI